MKFTRLLRALSLLALLVSFLPADSAGALAPAVVPPVDMFQLPWEQGLSWVALDTFDNGTKRLLNSPHNYLNGGALDFAPHNNMRVGEDTSNFWVTAAAAGTVVEMSSCHLKINHGNGWTSEYQYLANFQVKLGDAVYRNQRLAVIADGVGQQFCTPVESYDIPHLHFSVRPNMRNATFAGWLVTYIPLLNKTTFTKNGISLGSFQPILNAPGLQIALRDPITWDTIYIGNVDPSRYERWPFVLTETTTFTITATPTTSGLVPLLVLLDANGNEITQATGTLTSTQSAGNYFVQVQPQAGNGFYKLLLQRNNQPEPTGPFVSTVVTPTNMHIGDSATVMVNLGNVPAEGYTSAEFTCTYNPSLAEVSNIVTTNLFGTDAAVAINGPQNGSFIVAIAGSNGNKATTSGAALSFSIKGLQAGQMTIECKARVSKGDNVLTDLSSTAATLTILGNAPTPTPVVTPTPVASPVPTSSPAPSTPTIPPSACDKAEFIGDINVPPGTVMLPGATFTKTWRLKNVGSCAWTQAYQLVFFSGDIMSAPTPTQFTVSVQPGQTVDFSTNMTAPMTAGSYRGYWMFRNSSGQLFGIGPNGNEPWFVDITVSGPTVTPPPSSPTPTTTATGFPTPPSNWLTFTNSTFGFQFKYPPDSWIETGGTDTDTIIHLPFTPGTNLGTKYLQMIVAENANPCQSPLATQSMLETSETVVINGISFLKQTGQDGTAGHINKWTAYSTSRDNVCVSLDFVLRAANLGVFTTPPPLYDEAAESAVFGQIVSTYAWLNSPPTITPTATFTPTPTPIPTIGTLNGQVHASKPVTVNLYNADNSLATSTIADSDGTFIFIVSPGTYTVVAVSSGFLSAQGSKTLVAGQTITMPTVNLPAGDIDGNSVIDQFDAMTIGMSYNTAIPAAADLNSDGIINVLDLELLAANYRKSGALAWQ